MKLRYKILIPCITLITIGLGTLNYIGPRMIIEINNPIINQHKNDTRKLPKPSDYNLNSERFYIRTSEGFKLSGYIIKTDSAIQKGTLILVHGIRAYKEIYFPACKLLADHGYNSVIIDLRAHGESEGKYCTFGYKEKKDISIVIDSLSTIKGLNNNYGIWGQSMGAAVAMQTLATDHRLKYGIIESTFADFKTIVNDYAKNIFGFQLPILNNYLIWRAESIGGFEANDIVPSESAKHITQPVLMVHGKIDHRIKFKYGLKNFKNLKSKDKEFIEYKDANHLNVWKIGGEAYFQKVIRFLNRYSKNMELTSDIY